MSDPPCATEGCTKEGRHGCGQCRKWYCWNHDGDILVDRYAYGRKGFWCLPCVKEEHAHLTKILQDRA